MKYILNGNKYDFLLIFHSFFYIAFITIGKVAIQVKSNMGPYLDATLTSIKDALMIKG